MAAGNVCRPPDRRRHTALRSPAGMDPASAGRMGSAAGRRNPIVGSGRSRDGLGQPTDAKSASVGQPSVLGAPALGYTGRATGARADAGHVGARPRRSRPSRRPSLRPRLRPKTRRDGPRQRRRRRRPRSASRSNPLLRPRHHTLKVRRRRANRNGMSSAGVGLLGSRDEPLAPTRPATGQWGPLR